MAILEFPKELEAAFAEMLGQPTQLNELFYQPIANGFVGAEMDSSAEKSPAVGSSEGASKPL